MARLVDTGLSTCGFKNCAPCKMDGYESNEMTVVSEYLHWKFKNRTLVRESLDIGAHVGLWSAYLATEYAKYGGGSIFALEPEPRNFRFLAKNAEELARLGLLGVQPVMVAAWNTTETLSIQCDQNPGRHRVTNKIVHSRQTPLCKGIAIDDVSINDGGPRLLDFVKIDVEGAELNVLNGMRQTLEDNESILLLVEFSLEHFAKYGYNVRQISGFIKATGLSYARPMDKKAVVNIRGGDIRNIFFVKGDSPWQ